VHDDLLELVQPTGVVEVPMRRDRDRRPLEQVGQLGSQGADPRPVSTRRSRSRPRTRNRFACRKGST
jgi:hypothetical protein